MNICVLDPKHISIVDILFFICIDSLYFSASTFPPTLPILISSLSLPSNLHLPALSSTLPSPPSVLIYNPSIDECGKWKIKQISIKPSEFYENSVKAAKAYNGGSNTETNTDLCTWSPALCLARVLIKCYRDRG